MMHATIEKRVKALRKRLLKTEKSIKLPREELDASQREAIDFAPVLRGQISELERLLALPPAPVPSEAVCRLLYSQPHIPILATRFPDPAKYDGFAAYSTAITTFFSNLESATKKTLGGGVSFRDLAQLVENVVNPAVMVKEKLAQVEEEVNEENVEVETVAKEQELLVQEQQQTVPDATTAPIQFLVTPDAAMQTPTQNPVTESDLLAIIGGVGASEQEESVEYIAAPTPISFISPSQVGIPADADAATAGLDNVSNVPAATGVDKEKKHRRKTRGGRAKASKQNEQSGSENTSQAAVQQQSETSNKPPRRKKMPSRVSNADLGREFKAGGGSGSGSSGGAFMVKFHPRKKTREELAPSAVV